jgi:hypothetical protein
MFGIYCPVDDGYFIHFQGLLYSFKLLLDVEHQIIILDMGLSKKNIDYINNHFSFLNCKIIKTNTSRNDKLNYKFKIDTIEMILKDNYEYAIMLDAKDHLKAKLSEIQEKAKLNKVLINDYKSFEKDWTHNTCLETMGVINNEKILNSSQYQSNNVVFHLPQCREVIDTILLYGNNMNCLCPKGSAKSFEGESRHRQDQSVISISLKLHNIEATQWEYSTYHNTIIN